MLVYWWCGKSVFAFVEGRQGSFLVFLSMIGKYHSALSVKSEISFTYFHGTNWYVKMNTFNMRFGFYSLKSKLPKPLYKQLKENLKIYWRILNLSCCLLNFLTGIISDYSDILICNSTSLCNSRKYLYK